VIVLYAKRYRLRAMICLKYLETREILWESAATMWQG